MDISEFIGELLYEHDCVIVPGFGGFICGYKPAFIDTEKNTIHPPSKSISFNINLQSNDGLLVNYIAQDNNLPFQSAQDIVQTWGLSARSLLQTNKELTLKNIGTFILSDTNNVEFIPGNAVNYLKSSYRLKTIEALPIERGKQIELPRNVELETAAVRRKWSLLKIAAVLVLLGGISGLVSLMWAGVEIKPLNLNEASVFNAVTNTFGAEKPALKTIAVEVPAVVPNNISDKTTVAEVSTSTSKNESSPIVAKSGTISTKVEDIESQAQPGNYYVIIGVFAEEKNVEAAENRIRQKFPDVALLVEKSKRLTRVGYVAGTSFEKAKSELAKAQAENPDFWLLKK